MNENPCEATFELGECIFQCELEKDHRVKRYAQPNHRCSTPDYFGEGQGYLLIQWREKD